MILSEEVNLFHFYSLYFQHFTSLTPVPPLPPSVHFLLLISSHCLSFDSHLLRVSPSLRCITELPSDVIIRCPAAFSSSGMLDHKLFVAFSPSVSVIVSILSLCLRSCGSSFISDFLLHSSSPFLE